MHFIFKIAVGTGEGSKDSTHRAAKIVSPYGGLRVPFQWGGGGVVTYRKPDHES